MVNIIFFVDQYINIFVCFQILQRREESLVKNMDYAKKGEHSQGRGKGRAKKITIFSSGGNFVSARRPGGLASQKPDKNLEHQLLLENNMKSIVGAPKINPSLGKILTSRETNNKYLLTTKCNPALCANVCDRMVERESKVTSQDDRGSAHVALPGLGEKASLLQDKKWIVDEVSPTQTTIHPVIYPSQKLQQKTDPCRTKARKERKKKAAKKRMSKVQKMQRAELKEAQKFSNKPFLPKPKCSKAEWEKLSKGVLLSAGRYIIADDAASNSICSDSDLDESSDFDTSEYETSEDAMPVDDTSEDEASDQNISEERSTAQKEPLKPLSHHIPTWIDDSYPDDRYFQNANGEIFILCDDSDESSEDSDKSSEDSDESSEDSDRYYQNAFWEDYHSEDELSSSEEDEKPDVVLQPIQPAIEATPAENDCQVPTDPFGPPSSAVEKTATSKESPTQDSCHWGEADKLYDEWATEKTMQLLSGELGGPNLLQSIFGRTREGALIREDEPSRSRGGALEDDPNICKVCKIYYQRLLKHLGSSADCAQEYDLQKMHEENKAKSAAKRVENRRNKRKAERAEDEPAFKAKAAAQKKNQRDVSRAEDEAELRGKWTAEKKNQREVLRAEDEAELRGKWAAEKKNQRKREVTNQFDMIRKFWRDTEDGWSYSCVCCHKLKFDNQVVEFEEPLISRIGQQWIEEAIGEPDPSQERFGKYYICHYCKNKLLQNKMPPISHKNSLDLVDLEPHPELKTTPLENSLIAKNLVFQKIVQLPKSRWSGTKDKIVNVPINDQDIVDTVERLPRTPDEAGLVCIELKRKLEYKNTHKKEYISVSKVEKALDTLYDLGHPDYQFVGDMAGFEERCKKEEPLLSFDRLSDFSFKKTPARNGPKKCRKKPQLDFENFFKSLKKAPIWPFSFQFCINPYSFYFWGCQLDMTFLESEEFRRWPEEAQMLARDPWFIFIAKKNRMFWEGEPKRIYEAALSNGWKGAKLSPGLRWVGEDIKIGPTTAVITPSFTPNFEMYQIPRPKNWYYKRTVQRNKAKKVGRRRASIGTLSKAMLGEVVQCVPLSWQKCKPWRHFDPTTATG